MKKEIIKITFIFILAFTLLGIFSITNANEMLVKEQVETSSTTKTDILKAYDEFTEKYSNEEILKYVNENREEIKTNLKIDDNTLDAGTELLVSMDRQVIRSIIAEDINIEEIQRKIDEGYTPEQIVNDLKNELSTTQKALIIMKLFVASMIVRKILIISLVLCLYKIILRWIIFKKAGRHGWASIIPIYKQTTYLKVSKISPWWILILLIPVVGGMIFGIIKIISRFKLSKAFKRGVGFGFGLLFLPLIFESILAFNSNIKYADNK